MKPYPTSVPLSTRRAEEMFWGQNSVLLEFGSKVGEGSDPTPSPAQFWVGGVVGGTLPPLFLVPIKPGGRDRILKISWKLGMGEGNYFKNIPHHCLEIKISEVLTSEKFMGETGEGN